MIEVGPSRAGRRGAVAAWLARPAWPVVTLTLALALLPLPAYLLWDQLLYFQLRGDDFAFLAECHTGREPFANLGVPHNAHVVPLFRLLTAGLARLAGPPGDLPATLGQATYAALVLLMLGGGHLVAWETRRMALGLAAMVLIGVTTVIEPAATWYSAGQTLWTALAIVGTLVLLQNWRIWGGPAWLALAALPALAAPMLWSGGLVAGPAGWAYLAVRGDARSRRAALVPLFATLASLALLLALGGRGLLDAVRAEAPGDAGPSRHLRGLTHTAQAIPESLIAQNLGLDVATTPAQGVVFVLALALLWAWSRRPSPRPNPLEASGLAMVLPTYLLAFGLRGRYEFADLRDLGWYDTIPHVGAVLFASGWWAGRAVATPGRPARMTRGGVAAVAALAAVMLALHVPRALAILLREAPPLLPTEVKTLPIPELQRWRARFLEEDRGARQRRALTRLDRAATIANRRGFSRAAIRRAFGRVEVPGWPEAVTEYDALDLLDFPASGPEASPAAVRAALGPLLAPEPAMRPTWILPGDPWPPPRRAADPPATPTGPARGETTP